MIDTRTVWCWKHEGWVDLWHCDACECGTESCCATRYADGTTICEMCRTRPT